MGLHVGANLVEVRTGDAVVPLMPIPSVDYLDTDRSLDAIKFICKELWVACWDKQVDNLRTNHRVRSKICPLAGQ